MDEQLEHIPHDALRIKDYTHCGSQMIDNHSKDRSVKEVLMTVLVMHTEEDDTVLHIEKTGMLMLVVEIDVGGMTADVVDKLNCSSDDVEPRQVDLISAHALTKFHWHDTHVNLDRHEVDQRSMKILGNSHGVILPSWSRFVTIVKQTQEMDTVSYHKLFEILKQYQKEVKEIRVEKIARNANPLAVVAAAQQYLDTYYQAQKPQRSY
nr:Gag-Pol polyprotein [Tanacetum cinerariifolium]